MNGPFQSNQGKKKFPQYFNDSILESLRDVGRGVGKTVVTDVAGKVSSDALTSLFGAPANSGGELKQNQTIEFKKEQAPQPAAYRPELLRPTAPRSEDMQVRQQIEAVRAELKALAVSLSSLNREINKAIAEAPVDPGVYHANFFERLKSIIKIFRQQIEDSRTWVALTSRRKKQKQYWGLYKKHGTQFGLSSERTASTQSG